MLSAVQTIWQLTCKILAEFQKYLASTVQPEHITSITACNV